MVIIYIKLYIKIKRWTEESIMKSLEEETKEEETEVEIGKVIEIEEETEVGEVTEEEVVQGVVEIEEEEADLEEVQLYPLQLQEHRFICIQITSNYR